MKVLKQYLFIVLMALSVHVNAQSVYITKTGEKYHTDSCRFLKYSKMEIALQKAKNLGYAPCLVCKPSTKVAKEANTISASKSSRAKTPIKRTTAIQCTGRTQSGARCKRKTKNASGRCYQH